MITRRREMTNLAGDLARHRRAHGAPRRRLHVDFHPVDFPSPGSALCRPWSPGSGCFARARRGTALAFSAGDLSISPPQQAAILHDRLVGLAEMLVGAILIGPSIPPPTGRER